MPPHVFVAIAANSNYVMPTAVVISSLLRHRGEERVTLCLLHLVGEMSNEALGTLRTLTEELGGTFRPLGVSAAQLAKFPATRHGRAALLRLALPDLLPECDRVIYLDGDTLVCQSLLSLWQALPADALIAAGADTCPVYHPERPAQLGLPATHRYFNSGVVVMNLAALRNTDYIRTVAGYAEKYFNIIASPDQDALNYLCAGRTAYLPARYNMNYDVEPDVASAVWGKEEVRTARRNPVVIHYIGPVKPWQRECTHPKRTLWWQALRETPFANYLYAPLPLSARLRLPLRHLSKAIDRHVPLATKRTLGRMLPQNLVRAIKRMLHKA